MNETNTVFLIFYGKPFCDSRFQGIIEGNDFKDAIDNFVEKYPDYIFHDIETVKVL